MQAGGDRLSFGFPGRKKEGLGWGVRWGLSWPGWAVGLRAQLGSLQPGSRKKNNPRMVHLPHWVLETPEWRSGTCFRP